MGRHHPATWLAVFVVVANACSGLGLELARPGGAAQSGTVCAAQSAIASLVGSASAADVCRLQGALDGSSTGENASLESLATPLFGTVQHDPARAVTMTLPALDLTALIASAIPREASSAPRSPDYMSPPGPGSLDRLHHALLLPNGPPHLA